MWTDFQNSFTVGLSSKSVMKCLFYSNEVVIKDLTTPQTRRYTTLYVKRKFQETSDDVKMSSLTINLNFI